MALRVVCTLYGVLLCNISLSNRIRCLDIYFATRPTLYNAMASWPRGDFAKSNGVTYIYIDKVLKPTTGWTNSVHSGRQKREKLDQKKGLWLS